MIHVTSPKYPKYLVMAIKCYRYEETPTAYMAFHSDKIVRAGASR